MNWSICSFLRLDVDGERFPTSGQRATSQQARASHSLGDCTNLVLAGAS